jgi:hypothetical protein
MPRYVNQQIDARIQLIDINSDPVTGATVTITVLDEQGNNWDGTWNCAYLSEGVYHATFTPEREGDWTAIFKCGNPKFSKAIVYHVSDVASPELEWHPVPTQIQVGNPPVQNDWITVCDLTGNIKLLFCHIFQVNGETATKNIEYEITDDVSTITGSVSGMENGTIYNLIQEQEHQWSFSLGGGQHMLPCAYRGYDTIDGNEQVLCTENIQVTRFKLRMRITSVPGTNQNITGSVTPLVKGAITNNLA